MSVIGSVYYRGDYLIGSLYRGDLIGLSFIKWVSILGGVCQMGFFIVGVVYHKVCRL